MYSMIHNNFQQPLDGVLWPDNYRIEVGNLILQEDFLLQVPSDQEFSNWHFSDYFEGILNSNVSTEINCLFEINLRRI